MKLFILALLLTCFGILFAQTDTLKFVNNDVIKIDSIKIIGNDVTEEFVIKRELTFKEGSNVSLMDLNYSKERIYSLGLFNKVEIQPVKKNNIVYVQIDVQETWYIFPLPFFENKGPDLKKARFGFLLLHKNFRGRNETVAAKAGFGYDPFYSVTFQSPLLFKNSDIQFSAGIVSMKTTNKSDYIKKKLYETGKKNFDYRTFTGVISLGKRLNKFNRCFINFSYSYLKMPFEMEELTYSGKKEDNIFSAGLLYEFDSRNLAQNSSNGVYITGSFNHSGFGHNNIFVNTFNLDFRHYFKLSNNIFAKYRVYGRNIYGDNLARYSYSYLGVHEFVRGHKNEQREAKNMFFGSFELNYSILKEWNFNFKFPLIPEKLTSYRIGIVAKIFADAGTVYNGYKSLHFNGFDAGYGAGIMILVLPHNAFRFDYAINKYGKGEFIFGTGFSF